jgi:hypothetical protein
MNILSSDDFILLKSKDFCQYFKPISKCEYVESYNKLHVKSSDKLHDKSLYNSIEDVPNSLHTQLKKEYSLDNSGHGEDIIESILNKLNPKCEVIKNTHPHINCDFIIKNTTEPNIIVENKSVKANVTKMIVDLFKESCKLQQSNGILISQNSGIIGKDDFEIEIIGIFIVVYLSQNNYNEYKIKNAIEIITKLSPIIRMINTEKNDLTISHNTLNEIKEEYQKFSSNKNNVYEFISTTHSQLMHKLNNITLSKMGVFLATKFTDVDKPKSHLCNLCNSYTSNTLKGMAAHKRGCKKHNMNLSLL